MKIVSQKMASPMILGILVGSLSISLPIKAHAQDDPYPILEACDLKAYEDVFGYDTTDFGSDVDSKLDVVDLWSDTFHRYAKAILEYHLSEDNASAYKAAPHCDESTWEEFVPPGTMLSTVAKKLPPWKDPQNASLLSEDDIGAVLIELLDGYECVLQERLNNLWVAVADDEFDWREVVLPTSLVFDAQVILGETNDQRYKINRELSIARPIIRRSIQLIGGLSRLSSLDKELQCVQRSSLDLRNAFSAAAEASSCLPRIWNAKDPLRDICDDVALCDPQQ